MTDLSPCPTDDDAGCLIHKIPIQHNSPVINSSVSPELFIGKITYIKTQLHTKHFHLMIEQNNTI